MSPCATQYTSREPASEQQRINEYSSMVVLKQAVQLGVKEQLQVADKKIKEKIRHKFFAAGNKQAADDGSGS
ncbi:MAG TPA: hypothetical protein ENG92_00855 [Thiolapillus brandeum]|uniref:Uncharacterized protein n=1 Tax=Thiolapillus brandeum TaxID=1076588 RepID=A0A831NRR5_9GAMM|nr:hypothetical protein [Thiolapillus brandeum]